jgi:hypothetical protein
MRARSILFSSLLLVMGCSDQDPTYELVIATEDGPSPELVTKIESRLSDDPCLSEVATMRREYRFGIRDGNVERDIVHIKVQEAGIDELPSGRFIIGPSYGDAFRFDSRPYFVAFANYRVSSDTLDLYSCGDNNSGNRRHEPLF